MKSMILCLWVVVLCGCSRPTKEALIGIWYSEDEEKTSDYHLKEKGTVEFLRNGSFTSVDELTLIVSRGQEAVEITYNGIAAGEWQLHGDKLIVKWTDMKSTPRYVTRNAVRVDLAQVDPSEIGNIPRLEDFIPKGISEEHTILEMKSESMKRKRKNAAGEDVVTVSYRRDRHYQFK